MTQEGRQLLLVDLCARLPYLPICNIVGENGAEIDDILTSSTIEHLDVWVVKPYLRPLSSMTEDEKKDLLVTIVGNKGSKYFRVLQDGSIDNTDATIQDLNKFNMHWINFDKDTVTLYLDWLNKHHFDYRELIPKGLAISTKEFNPYKDQIMRGTEYKHVYALRNKDTGNYLLTYWASSQKHKALFSSRKKAEDAVKWIDANIEIVEL